MSGGSFPTIKAPSQVVLRSVQPTRVSVSHSLKRQARSRGGQRWGMQLTWAPMPRATFMQFFAFLIAQRGQADTFTIRLTGHTAPQGTWSGAPVVSGAGQTGRVINLRGLSASQAAAAKAGDILTFAGQTKVYIVTADAASNSAGLAAVTIEPALQASPLDGAGVTSSNVLFTVALASDSLDSNLAPGAIYSLAIDLVEVF